MAETTKVVAKKRDRAGKGGARSSRRDGLIPGVIYGDKQPPLMIAVDPKLRGNGLGRRLLYDLYDVLRARGVRQLVSWSTNAEMARTTLLQRTGFESVQVSVVHREEEAPHFETILAIGQKPGTLSE